ncbi:hypothetical protein 7F12_35 [uncultured Caudovirales phage]|uniref:Uncharacterized protein n=1 Tax=uncultured Caudovirales phage TaxID=2100421 RepID=A0A2H4JCJ7_9CAUD|nr:hypothetical protein 7F12_35 [uncultured Caudovirales phage]
MAKVSWILLAKDVLRDTEDNTIIVSPLTTIILNKFPQTTNFKVGFGLKDVTAKDDKILLGIGKIDNNENVEMLVQSEIELPKIFNDSQAKYADFESSVVLNNFEFREKGKYFASIQTNEQKGLTTHFNVTTKARNDNE